MNKNLHAYGKENIKSQIAGADSYTIIKMLMQGALDRLARGKGCIERKDLHGKSKCLSGATAIIKALNESLDFNAGSDAADNLSSLYEYMEELIGEATINNTTDQLVEVMSLLTEIKGAWDDIPQSEVDKALAIQAAAQAS